MLPVALALGTSWAVRGQIGHEYGATWAAAIGILTMISISGRKDWYERLPVIVVLGAIAWGAGGMMSYGKIVGYGFAPDYLNTSYGLLMLMIVGGLYGFMGGGITALTLSSTPEQKVDWAAVFTQMFVGGYLFWAFFIFQLEWFMTPPRSELWAACMGSALALGWYMYRNGYTNALRTAFLSALGSGFGFGFGNFLQRMGYVSGIKFNWWNVMEYSIGFFGGLGMAYGIFSNSKWPKTIAANRMSNIAAWIFLIILLPVINLIEGMGAKRMIETGKKIHSSDPAVFAITWQITMWGVAVMLMALLSYYYRNTIKTGFRQKESNILTLIFLTWYIMISNVVSAIWLTPAFSSQHLYWVNLVVIALLLQKNVKVMMPETNNTLPASWSFNLLKWWLAAIIFILILSYIALLPGYIHPNAQIRFE